MTDRINLLPDDWQYRQTLRRRFLEQGQKYTLFLIPLVEFAALFSLLLNAQAFFSFRQSSARVETASAIWAEKRELEENLSYFQKKSQAYRPLLENHRRYGPLLQTLGSAIPPSVLLKQLQISGESFNLSIQTGSITAFAQLLDNFLSSGNFKEVTLTETVFLRPERIYKISLEIPYVVESLFR